ncbi:hypothetical protein G5I_03692 [Acromyrmex echinatior]|uniref:Uncharacterized protein n=1 Tax=Acromyrmex echinatior TaxID=103372 RepID=F4WDN8_ACREC|nr:hypothetical protein G5I_03692 [Acromyrmex echinatior]
MSQSKGFEIKLTQLAQPLNCYVRLLGSNFDLTAMWTKLNYPLSQMSNSILEVNNHVTFSLERKHQPPSQMGFRRLPVSPRQRPPGSPKQQEWFIPTRRKPGKEGPHNPNPNLTMYHD